jgi:hypothetical protein
MQRAYRLKKAPDQIHDQADGERDQYHGRDRNEDAHTLAFVPYISGKAAKPRETTRENEKAYDYHENAGNNYQKARGAIQVQSLTLTLISQVF